MRIENIEVEYFKFIEKLYLNLNSKNCLIYGENGSGKSSLFESLYSVFYHRKRVDKSIKISDVFKNRNHKTENLKVKVLFNTKDSIERVDEEIENIDILPTISLRKFNNYKSTTLFANEKSFNRLIKENFYIAIKQTLFEHFPEISLLKIGRAHV